MTDLAFAEELARRAHAGQLEQSTGADYAHHLKRVAALVEGDAAKTVAWLHDIVEDTAVTCHLLDALGFQPIIVKAVYLLTREAPFDYAHHGTYRPISATAGGDLNKATLRAWIGNDGTIRSG